MSPILTVSWHPSTRTIINAWQPSTTDNQKVAPDNHHQQVHFSIDNHQHRTIINNHHWRSYQSGSLSLGPEGGGHNFLNVCTIQHFLFYPDFCAKYLGELSSRIVWGGGRAQILKCMFNSTFFILSWFFCQTFGGVINLDCCLRRGGHKF